MVLVLISPASYRPHRTARPLNDCPPSLWLATSTLKFEFTEREGRRIGFRKALVVEMNFRRFHLNEEARSTIRGSSAFIAGAKQMRSLVSALMWSCLPLVLGPTQTLAWGNEGHEYIATLAAEILQADSPETLKKVEDLLATDTGNDLTGNDIASEATWADAFRASSQHAKRGAGVAPRGRCSASPG